MVVVVVVVLVVVVVVHIVAAVAELVLLHCCRASTFAAEYCMDDRGRTCKTGCM